MMAVIIPSRADKLREAQDFPLKGKVLRYEPPTEPVAQGDWDVWP
jgi:hypothetical protein